MAQDWTRAWEHHHHESWRIVMGTQYTHSLITEDRSTTSLLPVITGKDEGNEVTDQSGGVQRVE